MRIQIKKIFFKNFIIQKFFNSILKFLEFYQIGEIKRIENFSVHYLERATVSRELVATVVSNKLH